MTESAANVRFTDTGSTDPVVARAGTRVTINMDTGGAYTFAVQTHDGDTGNAPENWITDETVTADYSKIYDGQGATMRVLCSAHSDTGNEAFVGINPPTT